MKLPENRSKWTNRIVWYRLDRKVILNRMSEEYLLLLFKTIIEESLSEAYTDNKIIHSIKIQVGYNIFKKTDNGTEVLLPRAYEYVVTRGDKPIIDIIESCAKKVNKSYLMYENDIREIDPERLESMIIQKKKKDVYHIDNKIYYEVVLRPIAIKKDTTQRIKTTNNKKSLMRKILSIFNK